jgi:hypothetical protein
VVLCDVVIIKLFLRIFKLNRFWAIEISLDAMEVFFLSTLRLFWGSGWDYGKFLWLPIFPQKKLLHLDFQCLVTGTVFLEITQFLSRTQCSFSFDVNNCNPPFFITEIDMPGIYLCHLNCHFVSRVSMANRNSVENHRSCMWCKPFSVNL